LRAGGVGTAPLVQPGQRPGDGADGDHDGRRGDHGVAPGGAPAFGPARGEPLGT
jgi:hypothetical protein